jgi:hypothetical protein
MLGDVGHPQLVDIQSRELSLDQIVSRRDALDPFHRRRARKPGNAGLLHERRDQALTHPHVASLGQLGMHPTRAVSAAALGVNVFDQRGKPFATHLRRSEWAIAVNVIARTRDAEYSTTLLHAEPGPDEDVDDRVNPFGRAASEPRSWLARRRISTSSSSSRIRLLALRSSLDSSVVRPGISPRSIRSCLI